MEYTKLGRIRPVYKGTWSASAAYTALDIVKNADGRRAYIAVKDAPKGTVLTDAAYWAPVLDVSDVLQAADAAISAANEAASRAPKPLALTEKSNPAVVWPEEGSHLRPTISMLPIRSGNPSPDNPRIISGRTAVTVTRCGKNLANVTYRNRVPSINDGLDVDAAGWASDYIHIGRNKAVLSITRVAADESFYLFLYDENKAFIGFTAKASQESTAIRSTDIPGHERARYCRLRLSAGAGTSSKLQLEFASDPTSFTQYQGDDFTIDFGQTVYGGVLNAAAGLLTVDRAVFTLDGVTSGAMLTTTSGSRSNFYYVNVGISNALWPPNNDTAAEIVSGHFKTEAWNKVILRSTFDEIAMLNNGCVGFAYNGTRDEANAWLAAQKSAGTPVQVCYRLAEPVVVQIDPAAIPALEGQNTVTSTGDGMELTYNKSLVREHEELLARIAALEAAAVNNA